VFDLNGCIDRARTANCVYDAMRGHRVGEVQRASVPLYAVARKHGVQVGKILNAAVERRVWNQLLLFLAGRLHKNTMLRRWRKHYHQIHIAMAH
jgi:hypothetical protein